MMIFHFKREGFYGSSQYNQRIIRRSKRLERSSGEIFLLAKGAAETERTYRVALAKEKMELREEGMSVGLIDDVARGNIADKRFERDLANLKYVAGRDSMKAIIAQLNALQSILRITKEM